VCVSVLGTPSGPCFPTVTRTPAPISLYFSETGAGWGFLPFCFMFCLYVCARWRKYAVSWSYYWVRRDMCNIVMNGKLPLTVQYNLQF
jgi:hypothetical protein